MLRWAARMRLLLCLTAWRADLPAGSAPPCPAGKRRAGKLRTGRAGAARAAGGRACRGQGGRQADQQRAGEADRGAAPLAVAQGSPDPPAARGMHASTPSAALLSARGALWGAVWQRAALLKLLVSRQLAQLQSSAASAGTLERSAFGARAAARAGGHHPELHTAARPLDVWSGELSRCQDSARSWGLGQRSGRGVRRGTRGSCGTAGAAARTWAPSRTALCTCAPGRMHWLCSTVALLLSGPGGRAGQAPAALGSCERLCKCGGEGLGDHQSSPLRGSGQRTHAGHARLPGSVPGTDWGIG